METSENIVCKVGNNYRLVTDYELAFFCVALDASPEMPLEDSLRNLKEAKEAPSYIGLRFIRKCFLCILQSGARGAANRRWCVAATAWP
jgi:hypothetical protein